MAITFIDKKNRLKYLFPILGILILVIIIVIWRNLFSGIKPLISPQFEIAVEKIEIDFEVFKNPLLEKLQPFPEIEPFTEEIDRENPFLAY